MWQVISSPQLRAFEAVSLLPACSETSCLGISQLDSFQKKSQTIHNCSLKGEANETGAGCWIAWSATPGGATNESMEVRFAAPPVTNPAAVSPRPWSDLAVELIVLLGLAALCTSL